MSDEAAGCEHEKVPVVRKTGQRLDLSRHDLGHPDDPELWDRLYRNCAVGVLVCGTCADDSPSRYLCLKVVNGHRRVANYTRAQLRDAGVGESPEHQALKDKVSALAVRQGLTADQEVSNSRRTRRTDVLVSGGVAPVGWEIQLSAINPPQLRRRIDVATTDGVISSWLTMRGSKAFSALIDRAPACTTKPLAPLDIATADDLLVFQGLKRLEIVRCTHHRTESWHHALTCTGFHAKPAPLGEHDHPTLERMITMTAAGEVVAIRWPRTLTLGNRRPWLWVPRADAREFYDTERPSLVRTGMAVTSIALDERGVPDSAGYHLGTVDAEPLATQPGHLAAILGNVCPRCGWTRNEHRWECPTGLSRHSRPDFSLWSSGTLSGS